MEATLKGSKSRRRFVLWGMVLAVLAFIEVMPAGALGDEGVWSAVGSMATARHFHTATLLPNDKVLVAGGQKMLAVGGYETQSTTLSSAELFDPATNSWSTTGSMATARINHTATLLPSGKVLVTGGYGTNSIALFSAEIYDPATNSWTPTGYMANSRAEHTATLLPGGKVLVVGGRSNISYIFHSSAELYDPDTNSWSTAGYMAAARYLHTATLLPGGKVLVAGGSDFNGYTQNAELYNPDTNSWSITGSMTVGRGEHTATLLPGGKVLVAGGWNLHTAELYDPATSSWSTAGFMATARYRHTATLLTSGKVLVAGGSVYYNDFSTSTELYDPAMNSWSTIGSMPTARSIHTATLLPSGKVLVAGGYYMPYLYYNDSGGSLSSAELYEPTSSIAIINNGNITYASTITPVYDALPDGSNATFTMLAGILTETLRFNRNCEVTLYGGYNSTYSELVGVTEIIGIFIIERGSVTINGAVASR